MNITTDSKEAIPHYFLTNHHLQEGRKSLGLFGPRAQPHTPPTPHPSHFPTPMVEM